MKRLILLLLLVLSHIAYCQQLTKELIIPNKYEYNKANNTYAGRTEYLKHIDIDDSTFLLITQFSYKPTSINPERIQPVIYKIKNTEKEFEILWKSKPYLDTSFTAYFGDMIVEDGKFKAVFLYQKTIITKTPSSLKYYPFFLDIDPKTGKIIDSVGYLGDFTADANELNSKICYIFPIYGVPSLKYDGKDLIILVQQSINDSICNLFKNISRTGVINSIYQLSHEPELPIMFIKNNDNMFRYTDLFWGGQGHSGSDHAASYYLNNELKWLDKLTFTPICEDNFTRSGRILSGSGFIKNNFCMFINYRDKSRNIDKVYAGYYNEIGRIKTDSILTNDVNFYREFATSDNEDNYYFSGFNNSLYPLQSFQVEQYKNSQKKSMIWKKDSLTKYILEVCPIKNDKAMALGIIFDTKNLIYSFYIAEIDFSKPNGVIEETGNLNLSVSPNPAEDYINISNINNGVNIEIYNLLGTKQFENIYNGPINISNLPIGVYYLKVGNQTAKFVKM